MKKIKMRREIRTECGRGMVERTLLRTVPFESTHKFQVCVSHSSWSEFLLIFIVLIKQFFPN